MSIREDLTKGVIWIAIAKYSGIVIQLIISAILARLIAPSAFGTVTIAIVLLAFMNILADIGIGPAVIQYKQLTKSNLNSLFTLTFYLGIILSVLLIATSGFISSYYEDPVLKSVCQIMSLVVFFNSLNVVPNALMRKDKRFRTIAYRTLFMQVSSGILAAWGALNGWGVYALLISPVLTSIGVFAINYYNYPLKYIVYIGKDALSMISSFSIYQFSFSFINYFSRNLDKLIIGRHISMEALGYYDKSYHLMMLPLQNVTYVLEPVLHPILSTLQNNKHELKEKNQKLAIIISRISFPIGILLYFCANEIIHIVYGDQWDTAVPIFRILSLSLPLQMILSTSGSIYQAAGHTDHMFYNGIMNTSITVSGFLIAAFCFGTIESMAWAWDITLVILFCLSYEILHRFTLRESSFAFFQSFFPQIANSVIVFVLVTILFKFIPINNTIVSLFCKTLTICAFTSLLAILLGQYNIFLIVKKHIR